MLMQKAGEIVADDEPGPCMGAGAASQGVNLKDHLAGNGSN